MVSSYLKLEWFNILDTKSRELHEKLVLSLSLFCCCCVSGMSSVIMINVVTLSQSCLFPKILSLAHFYSCVIGINDIPNDLSSTIRLYTDDALLYRTIHSGRDVHALQNDLDILNTWATKWQMSRITNKIKPLESHYHLQNTPFHAKY